MEELRALEEQAPQLGPWIGQVRALAQVFQTKRLREVLRASADAGAGRRDAPA